MKSLAVLALVLVFAFGTQVHSQQHPEHPEHPEEKAAASKMTLEALAEAITDYIEDDSELKGGSFLIFDPMQKKVLQLELVKVHKERLASLGDDVYFACTDMKGKDDVVYDLDFFMKHNGHGIETTEVSVHKQAGKPRYGWKEENGIWKKTKSN